MIRINKLDATEDHRGLRADAGDLVFKSKLDKFRYVLRDIREKNSRGQPVLCGTTSIEDAT